MFLRRKGMRTFRDLLCLFFGVLMMALVTATANAQGVIVPGPCRRCPVPPRPIPMPRALPVKSIKIDTKIGAQVATTHVEQVFRNDSDATLEGTYFFPIPETGSVVEFAIWGGDKRPVGDVRSREEARRIYDEIVRRQRDPGLLEYAGRDLFQASIFPIPPPSDTRLELPYTQVLKAEGGTVNYRYPLGTGRNVAQIEGTVSGRVEIEGREPVRNIYSPSHEIEVARRGGRRARRAGRWRGGGGGGAAGLPALLHALGRRLRHDAPDAPRAGQAGLLPSDHLAEGQHLRPGVRRKRRGLRARHFGLDGRGGQDGEGARGVAVRRALSAPRRPFQRHQLRGRRAPDDFR